MRRKSKANVRVYCFMCGMPCASWCEIKGRYFCADHDPICGEEMRPMFKELETYFLLTFVYPPDQSILQ
jgi:hypothetical protein